MQLRYASVRNWQPYRTRGAAPRSRVVLVAHAAACNDLPVRHASETVVKVALVIGICLGGAAAVTSVFPASARWTEPFVCDSGYELAYRTSRSTQSSNRTSTSVHFQCLADVHGYDANVLLIGALQTILVAFVLGVALLTVRVIASRRDGRNQADS